jgi:translation elongation factor P/translation initiation factor 5A
MKKIAIFAAGAALLAAAGPKKTFTGVVSDDMCGADHKVMKVKPDSKCVTECVKMGSKYVLVAGGNVYVLSDQKTPEKYAGQKVTVTGSLDGKTLQVDSMAAAK